MSAVQIQGVFSHPATEITGSYPRRKCKRGPRCAVLPLCSPSWGPFLEALGEFGIFFPSQKAAGSRQITVICTSSFSGRAACLFHLGNNRLLAEPPAQTQAAGEQRELESLAQVLATVFAQIIGVFPQSSAKAGSELPEQNLSRKQEEQEEQHCWSGKRKGGLLKVGGQVAPLWRGPSWRTHHGRRSQRQKWS